MIATIAAQQVQSLRRRRVFSAFMGIFVAMTVLAGGIGWSSHTTIVRVYDEAVGLLAADGKGAPANPFDQVPTLSLLSNLAIYITLIGALMAIIVGHVSLADDQSSGIGRLIFSRPISRTSYLAGKLAGAAIVVAAALATSMAISLVALRVANGTFPSPADIGRLAGFFALSWLYLMIFVLIGMDTVLVTGRRSLALLVALGTWLVITFAVPQFTSGLRPTTSLNPVTDPASTSQTFFQITAHARPASIAEQYKTAGAQILDTATTGLGTGPGPGPGMRIVPLAAGLVVLIALAVLLVRRHDYSEASTDD